MASLQWIKNHRKENAARTTGRSDVVCQYINIHMDKVG